MSGKCARRLRKNQVVSKKSFSKKALAVCAGLCISAAPVTAGGEFLISLFPHFTKPFGESHSMEYGIGGGLRATYRPIKFLNIFAEGDYLSMAIPGIDPVSVLQGQLGTGFHLDVTDRISLDFNVNAGVYNAKASKAVNGFSAGGALVFSYKITPSISVDAAATANHFAGKPTPLLMVNAGIAPGITLNITELFNNKTNIGMELSELDPVFPVLYSWYENNSFGKVTITNKEDTGISDVTVSFFQPQYMAHAKECATIDRIKSGESATVDMYAFFNEQMLELTEKTDTSSYIIVNYSKLGKKLSQTFVMDVPVYGRNNMSWDDDRRAAVFVSSKDPAAMQFGKYTASIVRENLRPDVPVNIQYALGIFEALNQYGINYVVDPSSAFEDNVGTSAIDFLQFPYQTLMYRGGDCDDLSILVCSLFEAVGVDTAFITVPGHIFMAFDAGITPEMARTAFRNTANYIFIDDQVWVPLEITLSDEGFYKACRYGAMEWNSAEAQGAAALYKMSDSWKIYQPISVPGATAYFNMPDSNAIYLAFENGIDKWSKGELKSLIPEQNIQFVMRDEEETEEQEVIIDENLLSGNSVKDLVALAGKVSAVVPAAIREEELEDDNEEDDEEELIENILPLDFALATLQTDVTPIVYPTHATVIEPEVEKTDLLAFNPDASEPVQDKDNALSMSGENPVSSTGDDMSLSGLTGQSLKDSDVQIAGSSPAMTEDSSADTDALTSFDDTVSSAGDDDMSLSGDDDLSLSGLTGQPSPEASSPAATKNILIISGITLAAALAAGIIIFGKKKREGESK